MQVQNTTQNGKHNLVHPAYPTCRHSHLGDPLDLVTQNLAVTFGTTLSKTLTTFATSRHCRN